MGIENIGKKLLTAGAITALTLTTGVNKAHASEDKYKAPTEPNTKQEQMVENNDETTETSNEIKVKAIENTEKFVAENENISFDGEHYSLENAAQNQIKVIALDGDGAPYGEVFAALLKTIDPSLSNEDAKKMGAEYAIGYGGSPEYQVRTVFVDIGADGKPVKKEVKVRYEVKEGDSIFKMFREYGMDNKAALARAKEFKEKYGAIQPGDKVIDSLLMNTKDTVTEVNGQRYIVIGWKLKLEPDLDVQAKMDEFEANNKAEK